MNPKSVTPSSYFLFPGFYHTVVGNTAVPRQRFVTEVRYPAAKEIMECEAISKTNWFIAPGGTLSTTHATAKKPGRNGLFVDGHASFFWWDRWQKDPAIGALPDGYARLSWQDLRY